MSESTYKPKIRVFYRGGFAWSYWQVGGPTVTGKHVREWEEKYPKDTLILCPDQETGEATRKAISAIKAAMGRGRNNL